MINPINTSRAGLSVNRSSRFPPLSLAIIAALTPDSWDVMLLDETWEPFAYHDADLVGITSFTATASRAYEIARVYRAKGVPVVLGGIHASMCPEEALKYVDCVVVGEAEAVWPAIITDFERGALQTRYHGSWGDLAGYPPPKRDLFDPRYMFASVQTSRGCPMNCDFCSVTAFNGRRYRRRPVAEVLDELSGIREKLVFFVDDNIIGYGEDAKKGALALFKGMVERKLDKWWFCQASINFADDEEILKWASLAGCKMVFLGLEADDESALAEINKQLNLKRKPLAYSEAFKRIHRAGIAVLGAFIFGMDGDNPAKLCARAKYMAKSAIDVMQITHLTPLPGTRLFERIREDGRLIYTDFPADWNRYDMTQVVHRTLSMTEEDLAAGISRCSRKLYSWPVILRKAYQSLLWTHKLTTTMFALQSNINYRNVSKHILNE